MFIVAMLMLGVAAAVVVLRQAPAGKPAGPRHHYLDSPYQVMLFHKGQPHIQSNRAIGHAYPRDLSRAYVRAGYEWVSVTDVNTLTPVDQYTTPGAEPLAGTEAAFPFGHLLELGVEIIPPANTLQKAIDDVHAQAGTVIVSHPRAAPAVTADQVMASRGIDAVEIYNARLQKENPAVADATAMWDDLLTRGRHVWATVGDDSIELDGPASTVGSTAVWIQAPEVLGPLVQDAIHRGAFYDSTGVRVLGVDLPTSDTIRVITADATTIKWYGKGGALLATTHGNEGSYKVDWSEQYVRAVASRDDGAQAWTMPVFVIP